MDFSAGIMRKAHRPAGRFVETGDAVEYSGLAGAVRPDQRGDLAPPGVQREIIHRNDTAKTHGQMIDGENAIAAHHP